MSDKLAIKLFQKDSAHVNKITCFMQIQLNMLRSFHFVFIIIYLLYDRIYHFKTMIDIISHGMCHVHCFCKLSYEDCVKGC